MIILGDLEVEIWILMLEEEKFLIGFLRFDFYFIYWIFIIFLMNDLDIECVGIYEY